ncbi:MAG: hypothetical protein KC646_06780 [Candidatus Cloacimonetes bacterium]|nr:hypothetical protein [Candidatus Cloacimonadota bacterium]
MRQITLLSILGFILCVSNIHATKEMAQKEKMSCVQCHKTSRGGRKGKPNLKSRGIKYIKKLVEKEGYVPKSRIRQLTFLAAKIKANKLKIDSKAREAQEKIEKEKAEKLKAIEEAKKKVELAKQKEQERIEEEARKKIEAEIKKKAEKKLIAEGKIDPVTLKPIQPKLSDSVKKSLGKSSKGNGSGSENPLVKGPKTVILKRKNVGPKSYDHLSDWEFDDYF